MGDLLPGRRLGRLLALEDEASAAGSVTANCIATAALIPLCTSAAAVLDSRSSAAASPDWQKLSTNRHDLATHLAIDHPRVVQK